MHQLGPFVIEVLFDTSDKPAADTAAAYAVALSKLLTHDRFHADTMQFYLNRPRDAVDCDDEFEFGACNRQARQ